MANTLTFNSGPLEARVSEDTGGGRAGRPRPLGRALATVIAFEPPVVTIGGAKRTVGRVVSSTPRPNGFDLVQDAGGTNVKARLTFPADGVMRYEVTDWNGLKPDQTSIAAASAAASTSTASARSSTRSTRRGTWSTSSRSTVPGNKGDHSYKVAPWFVSTRGYGFHLDSTVAQHLRHAQRRPTGTSSPTSPGRLPITSSTAPR